MDYLFESVEICWWMASYSH